MKDLAVPWITFEYLPAYSPETQSSGSTFVDDQYGRLANWPAPDVDSLHERVQQELDQHSIRYNSAQEPHPMGRPLDTVRYFASAVVNNRQPQ